MPSFDVVCELDEHELNNAVDQANREVSTRFDFKGVGAQYSLNNKGKIKLEAEVDFQLNQMLDILKGKLTKRSIDVRHLSPQDPVIQSKTAVQEIVIKEGIDKESGKKLAKRIKLLPYNVQVTIQGDQVRVTSKKRDDLQGVISHLKEGDFELPLQYVNFRD